MEGYRMFKRKIYSKLQEWKREENGRTALLIKGARRVGERFLVYTKDLRKDGTVTLLPVMMTMFI